MQILPEASLFLRFSASLLLLPTPSAALPPDDLHLFFTIFAVLFLTAIVISVGFAAALYLFWSFGSSKKSEKNWPNGRTFSQLGGQTTKMDNENKYPKLSPFFAQPTKFKEQKVASEGISMPRKISKMLKRRGQSPSVTHFPSESPQPSYISVMGPSELSPQQTHQFPSSLSPNGQVPSSSRRLRSILKKPKIVLPTTFGGLPNGTAGKGTVVAAVSYRIPVQRADIVPSVRAQVPRKWTWSTHFGEFPSAGDRVVEDRVEREECLRNGRLLAVERLTRTVRASADVGGQSAATFI